MASTSQPSEWADLLPELLGRVIARLPFPDDLARLRAVCRPWHSAVREHVQPGLPWIIHSDGTFVTYDYGFHRGVPFPDNTKFIGANGSWLALYRTDIDDGRRSYLLHNPFTKTTVPLPGLDTVIGKVSNRFEIRKVLMRSDQHDLIAVTTNNSNYPIILCRPGRPGAWFPQQPDIPYASIYDVAFHAGNLYGITDDKKLVVLVLDEDHDGTPNVKMAECVINYMPGDEEEADDDDGEASGSEYEEEVVYNDASSFDEENEDDGQALSNGHGEGAYYDKALSSDDLVDEESLDVNGEFEDDNATSNKSENEDNEDVSSNEAKEEVVDEEYGKATPNNSSDEDKYYEGDGLVPIGNEDGDYDYNGDHIVTSRHLIESSGKLLMLRRQRYILSTSSSYTLEVEVVEADLGRGGWAETDVTGTIFVSDRHSVHVPTLGEDDEWVYFADEHDVLDFKSQTLDAILDRKSTWFFPRELVI